MSNGEGSETAAASIEGVICAIVFRLIALFWWSICGTYVSDEESMEMRGGIQLNVPCYLYSCEETVPVCRWIEDGDVLNPICGV